MIVNGEVWMIPALSQIWEVCFGDSPEYIQFFMERKFPSCHTLVWLENGNAVGSVYLLPCSVEGRNAYYGYAGGVLPQYRKKGIFESLLNHAELFCKKRNATFIFVPIEGSEMYYQKRGFESAFFFHEVRYSGKGLCQPYQLRDADAALYLPLRDRAFSEYPYLRWDELAVDYALAENRLCGGFAKILTTDQDDLLFGRKNDSVLEIWETSLSPESAKQIAPFLCNVWDTEEVVFRFPAVPGEDNSPNGGSFGHLKFHNGWMGLSLA